MDPERLRKILKAVEQGEMTADGAAEKLRTFSFEDLGFAKVDHHRSLRRGFPEVIFGPGKSPSQIAAIATRLAENGQVVLVTKTTVDAYRAVAAVHPESVWHEEAFAITVGEASSARVSISRDLLMSQFWQNLQDRLQPAVPKDSVGVPGRKWFRGFFSIGSTQKPEDRP